MVGRCGKLKWFIANFFDGGAQLATYESIINSCGSLDIRAGLVVVRKLLFPDIKVLAPLADVLDVGVIVIDMLIEAAGKDNHMGTCLVRLDEFNYILTEIMSSVCVLSSFDAK
jgi:hypothetical protein